MVPLRVSLLLTPAWCISSLINLSKLSGVSLFSMLQDQTDRQTDRQTEDKNTYLSSISSGGVCVLMCPGHSETFDCTQTDKKQVDIPGDRLTDSPSNFPED